MVCVNVQAETKVLNLDKAIELALNVDPRIREQRHLEDAAKGLVQEVQGHKEFRFDFDMLLGVAPTLEGGFYEGGANSGTTPRSDIPGIDEIDKLTPWFWGQGAIIKPIYTFGKIKNYKAAAEGKVKIQEQEIRLQKGKTIMDVSKAYYGFLTARDIRYLLEETDKRLVGAETTVKKLLKRGRGKVKRSDLHALKAAMSLVAKFKAEANSAENIAMAGLHVLTGVDVEHKLQLEDRRIRPVDLPESPLDELKSTAMKQRPEMAQLVAGLKARRALVAAKKSDKNPNLYVGAIGMVSYTPGRSQLNNPHLYDVFNLEAFTPMVGIRWQWLKGPQRAQVVQAQAELNALIDKSDLAKVGIPFEVAETYYEIQALHQGLTALREGSRSARRWMVASLLDFEAGVEEASKIMDALQAYVLMYSDYLKAVNDYNMKVARLNIVTGAYQ